MKNLVLGLDCSTSAVKAVVWDQNGASISVGRCPLEILRPSPHWHEQNAETWWACTCASLREAIQPIDPARIAGIAISHQRETFVPIGKNGQPVRNGILWMDERAADQIEPLAELIDRATFQKITGKPISGNLSVVKIAWIKEHEVEVWQSAAMWLDVHAFLVHRLTGNFATGWGCADPTGMFDIETGSWSEDICRAVGIGSDQLPKTFPAGEWIGSISVEAARETGLLAGTPVFAGLGDGQAAALGMNIVQAGDAAISLGTSVITSVFSPDRQVSRAFRTTCAGIPGTYLYEMVLLGGAYTIEWFLSNFAGSETIQDFERTAREIQPGSGGLMLVPYWNSAMNPYWDSSASGIIVGWRGYHNRSHLYRAILEGIAYEVRLEMEGAEKALGSPVNRLVVTGGGSKSDLWREIIANVTGLPVYRSVNPESAALGAGILAAAGAGIYPDVQSAANAMSGALGDPIDPAPDHQRVYDRLYHEVYLGLYPGLKESLHHLAIITQGNE